MTYILQQALNGLQLGSIYALIALGYTMVYGILTMINFAHGDLFMVGAFLCFVSVVIFKAVLPADPVGRHDRTSFLGVVIERLALQTAAPGTARIGDHYGPGCRPFPGKTSPWP